MTTLLRILTGTHAGAEVRLGEGSHYVGLGEDADVQISDWNGSNLSFEIVGGEPVRARRQTLAPVSPTPEAAATDDASGAAQHDGAPLAGEAPLDDAEVWLLTPFTPVQFGDIVLCVGPDESGWPSDIELLSSLLGAHRDAQHGAAARGRKLMATVCAILMLGAVVAVGGIMLTTMVSRAAQPRDKADLAQRLNAAFRAARLSELQARVQGANVVIGGMVATRMEDEAARTLFGRFAPAAIRRHYDIAQNDARDIEDSLGAPGAHVAYAGHGSFSITGSLPANADVPAVLARLRRDMSANIRELRVSVTPSDASDSQLASFSEVIVSDDIRYAQTPDGVKHIYVPPDGAPAPDAIALPAPASAPDEAAASAVTALAAAPAPPSASSPLRYVPLPH